MPYTLAAKLRAKKFVARVRKRTYCIRCGGQPIEWHHKDHTVNTNHRVCHLASLGFPLERIKAEIRKCTAFCRSCHMREDGRLEILRKDCPNQKGVILVGPKKCKQCPRIERNLRKGLCNRCNHRRRAKEKRSNGY